MGFTSSFTNQLICRSAMLAARAVRHARRMPEITTRTAAKSPTISINRGLSHVRDGVRNDKHEARIVSAFEQQARDGFDDFKWRGNPSNDVLQGWLLGSLGLNTKTNETNEMNTEGNNNLAVDVACGTGRVSRAGALFQAGCWR
jgi:hypothetical protein